MAKGARSNSQKKLRTQRREEVTHKTKWIATAEDKRQAALAACMAAEPLEVPKLEGADTAMTVDKPAPIRVAKKQKLKGAVVKKGKNGKKVSVLAGKNQFHKKGRKGNRN
ncbi:hypothetical protein HXX76_010376 [Chlamydomonas incerta]|uniref:Uncharacterized protein n=1 Tax=Chlamydomonas incerta TaxID=51695 RepID=A0A835T2C0_CHLIN|nr:hypothetical protein HXX76_010376 [Chlamydomonas incerta]|eukprot:KAG2430281.1 hypothetical protein HXX76_010376 [Chlamydomonas incerta]